MLGKRLNTEFGMLIDPSLQLLYSEVLSRFTLNLDAKFFTWEQLLVLLYHMFQILLAKTVLFMLLSSLQDPAETLLTWPKKDSMLFQL